MIRNTFSILRGIGNGLEKRLWKKGILHWEDFINTPHIGFINYERKSSFDKELTDASKNLSEGNLCYFASNLKLGEHWRLFELFKDQAVYLDIETNGYPHWSGGHVTVVGLFDGYDYKSFVRGENLTAQSLEKELSRYKYLVTFFGSGFDMPFLRESMGVEFKGAHFDLCFGARRLGIRGGLKKIEEIFGLERDEAVKGFDGYDAVRLWREARNGNSEAYQLLLTYNKCDTVNLFALSKILYKKLKAGTGIEEFLN